MSQEWPIPTTVMDAAIIVRQVAHFNAGLGHFVDLRTNG
jgi:hypothetical protein